MSHIGAPASPRHNRLLAVSVSTGGRLDQSSSFVSVGRQHRDLFVPGPSVRASRSAIVWSPRSGFAPAYLHGEPAPSTLDGVDVTFEVSGDLLALPEGQTTILAEKLRLFAAGQFPHEVRKLEKLGTSRAWLAGTREAADLIEMALVDERSGPVRLVRGDVADAVFQVMRLSYADSSDRAGAAGLAEALEALSEPGG